MLAKRKLARGRTIEGSRICATGRHHQSKKSGCEHMSRIFITGASGFVGGAITRALAPHHTLAALSRSERSDAAVRALGAAAVRGELGAVPVAALAGCDAVIHCAAFVKQWGTREQFWNANVAGTSQLLEAAKTAGVRRFIHIGTEAALFHGQDMRDIDEQYPYPARTPFLYSETKAVAEKRVLAANTGDFQTLSIRPRFVWGPGDETILPVLVAMVKAGRFTWIDGGRARTSTTHIANLVHAVELALQRGAGGNAYFVTDEGSTTFREFLAALLATRGISAPERSLPGWVARTIAALMEVSWRALSLEADPPLTRFAASMMSRECTIRIDKARRELGYAPVISREDGLQQLM
jgi:nucleoside-diphosphate-sugar epimerase